MPFMVQLTDDAAQDLAEIHQYIHGHESPEKADPVLNRIEEAFRSLSEHPDRETTRRSCWILESRNAERHSSSRIA